MSVNTIGIVGIGSMGNGIAQVAAQSGFSVIVRDMDEKILAKGIGSIDKFLSKSVEKGKMTAEQKAAVLGQIKTTTKIEDLKAADFIIEAAFESMDVKKKIFAEPTS